MKDFQAYSRGAIALPTPCPTCKYSRALVIIWYKGDAGFAQCGQCDSPLFSMEENRTRSGHFESVLEVSS